MKKLIWSLVVVMVLGIASQNAAYARDEGWYVAGGVLAGLATAAIISDINRPRYYQEPVYVQPVVYSPVYRRPRSVYRYDNYRPYRYRNCGYTTTTVYGREVVRTW